MIWWAFLLFLAGLMLILAEFFIPGGISGLFGFAMLVGSTILGTYAYPDYAVPIIFFELFSGIICLIVGIMFLTRSKAGGLLRLESTQRVEDGYVNVPSDMSLIGAVGEVYTPLRPAGTILLGGRRIDAVSDGTLIDKGATIRVIEVHGNRVVVEALATPQEQE